jgi:hypothetical protein
MLAIHTKTANTTIQRIVRGVIFRGWRRPMRLFANDAGEPHDLALNAYTALERFRIAGEGPDPAIAIAVLDPFIAVLLKQIENHRRSPS